MTEKPNWPRPTWQPKIDTAREVEALEALAAYFCTMNHAEAVRHALRVMVSMLDLGEYELTLEDEFGEVINHDVLPREPYDREEDGAEPVELRRWTVVVTGSDRENLALLREWLDGDASWRDVMSTAIVRMGELVTYLNADASLWAESREDDSAPLCLVLP